MEHYEYDLRGKTFTFLRACLSSFALLLGRLGKISRPRLARESLHHYYRNIRLGFPSHITSNESMFKERH